MSSRLRPLDLSASRHEHSTAYGCILHPYILSLLLHYLIAFLVSTEEVPPERRVKSANYLDKLTTPASNAIIRVEPFSSFLLQSRWRRQESKRNVRPAKRLQMVRRKPIRVVRRKAWPSQRDREADRVVWKLAERLWISQRMPEADRAHDEPEKRWKCWQSSKHEPFRRPRKSATNKRVTSWHRERRTQQP